MGHREGIKSSGWFKFSVARFITDSVKCAYIVQNEGDYLMFCRVFVGILRSFIESVCEFVCMSACERVCVTECALCYAYGMCYVTTVMCFVYAQCSIIKWRSSIKSVWKNYFVHSILLMSIRTISLCLFYVERIIILLWYLNREGSKQASKVKWL